MGFIEHGITFMTWSSNPVAAEYTVTDYSVSLLELL